ncbi:MerR family transcriptional regulator [Comamonas sp. w2-DMI]|uniref:MerR family transcriptional regulator n=1 Tax=Comamonas terrae TaxID=673548 RepID=A0ABW5USU6_9BURK|nr:MerR family transcriptional regulator [Comamonas terrae]
MSGKDLAAPRWRIGEAARRSGVAAPNIRYYEREQLLSPGVREDNQYRLYSDADLHRLRFIRLCRAMDMSLDEVRRLLALDGACKADCVAARETLDAHLEHVRERLKELRALEHELEHLRSQCDGTDSYCHIIETLHAQADEPLPEALHGNAAAGKRHV